MPKHNVLCFVCKLTVTAQSHLVMSGELRGQAINGSDNCNGESENSFLLYSDFDALIFDIVVREPGM